MTNSSKWTLEQNKLFENALAAVGVLEEETPERWEKVAAMVPGKTSYEVQRHYHDLVEDLNLIDAGFIEIPSYTSSSSSCDHELNQCKKHGGRVNGQGGGGGADHQFQQPGGNKGLGYPHHAKSSDQERRKGVPWTEEEHRLFLMGLNKYGKGDWRSISRNFVVSRTPTQVASHAQKYFIRRNSGNKDKRRSSIHDITSVNSTEMRQAPVRQPAAIPLGKRTSSMTTRNNQTSIFMSQPSQIRESSLLNSVGFSTGNNTKNRPSRGLGLYNHSGVQVHSSIPLISGSSLGVSQSCHPM